MTKSFNPPVTPVVIDYFTSKFTAYTLLDEIGHGVRRIAEIVKAAYPSLFVSLASEICPEVREYDRQSTTVANAYVQPLIARYLAALEARLAESGFACPCLLMTSGGSLVTIETAAAHPIRLVESGPAGGAVLASAIARELGESTHPAALPFALRQQHPGCGNQQREEQQAADDGDVDLEVEAAHQPSASWLRANT